MIKNLLVFVVALCAAGSAAAEAEPHSGAHAGAKVTVAEAEPHSGAHAGAKLRGVESKVTPAVKTFTKEEVQKLVQSKNIELKHSLMKKAAKTETKTAQKREFVRGQSVQVESLQQPPKNVAGNRLLVQKRVYNSDDCNEDSLYVGGGYAANICIPEYNVIDGTAYYTTTITALKTNSPDGAHASVVQNYYYDDFCSYLWTREVEPWDSMRLELCQPSEEFPGKFEKFIANKEVQLPTATKTGGVLWADYGGIRGCEEQDILGLVGYTFYTDDCLPDSYVGYFKYHCDENRPKMSFYADDACTDVTSSFELSDMCTSYSRATCITTP